MLILLKRPRVPPEELQPQLIYRIEWHRIIFLCVIHGSFETN